jgi:hypothetical protein
MTTSALSQSMTEASVNRSAVDTLGVRPEREPVSPRERARIDVKGSASAWFDALADEEHAMLGERDGGGDLSVSRSEPRPLVPTDRLARLARNQCVLSIGTHSLTAVAALALGLVGCGEADSGMDGKAPSADTERTSTLFLAGDGEMWVVDAEAARAQHLLVPVDASV